MGNRASEDNEVFKLEDGEEVSVGLNLPESSDELDLMSSVEEYPQSYWLDAGDIEKALVRNGEQQFNDLRKKRRRRMRNQGRIGKCNASSNCSALEQLREVQGMPDVALSDCHLYTKLCGGQDRGSSLISSFREVQAGGVSPMEVQVGGMTKMLPNQAFRQRDFSRGQWMAAQAAADQNRGLEFYKAPSSFKDFCVAVASAIARQHPIIFAWHVGNSSMRLRSGYVVTGRGRGNHSNVFHSGKWVGGSELVHPDNQNSWGPCSNKLYGRTGGNGWGEGGFALFTMEQAFSCTKYHHTYICPSIKADAMDPALQ